MHAHSSCQHRAPGPQLLCQAWYAQVISKMVPSPNILQSNWLPLHLKYSHWSWTSFLPLPESPLLARKLVFQATELAWSRLVSHKGYQLWLTRTSLTGTSVRLVYGVPPYLYRARSANMDCIAFVEPQALVVW